MPSTVSGLRRSIATGLALDWQRAWANAELGYEPSDEELQLLDDARRRPDYYLSAPARRKSHKPQRRRRSREDRPYKLPFTIV